MEILIYTGLGAIAFLIGMLLYSDNIRLADRPKIQELPEDYDRSTEELIGHDAYVAMLNRVDTLMSLHADDQCTVVNLTTAGDSADAMHELHHLLPGEPLETNKYMECGMECVGIYSRGMRIGSLMLQDAAQFLNIANTMTITGVYVARQDCYNEFDTLDLGIIIYYTRGEATRSLVMKDLKDYLFKVASNRNSCGMDISPN